VKIKLGNQFQQREAKADLDWKLDEYH